MLPPLLVEHAGLGKEVVVIGCDDWIEIWDRERWRGHELDSDAVAARRPRSSLRRDR